MDSTRTAVLEWALKLEEEGVIGEEFSFSKEEQAAAASIVFNIGSMSHSQIQGATRSSTQTFELTEINHDAVQSFVNELHPALPRLNLGHAELEELTQEIATLKAQLGSPKPKSTILRESLRSIRNILEGTTGSVLATEMLTRLGPVLGV